ncbi:MAG TPA: DsbA family oxidoreductase, partial [Piscinibacter sp.]|nr:DsbA family oxidoreductase [Piscinibacter sp.]
MKTLKIDFVSDVVCPWCAIGLASLEIALKRLQGEVAAELHFQPFELHPDMGPEGVEVVPYLAKKYGMSAEQVERNQQSIAERGKAVGFEFRMERRSRTWNTFDAHRLLHWAGEVGAAQQRALKHALLSAHFTEGENPGAREVLLRCAAQAGLDATRAAAVVDGDEYADAVREREQLYQQAGISSVPSVIVNERYLIQG